MIKAWPLLCCLLLLGCRQEMADQPHYKPLQADSFFDDGRASRPLEPGVVARGHLRDDPQLYSGKKPDAVIALQAARDVARGAMPPVAQLAMAAAKNPKDFYYDTFPFEVTREVLDRGRQRFDIFCSVCHDRTGSGNGTVVQRGFTKPPNFYTDQSRGLAYQGMQVSLRDVPAGYIFDVITNGYGAMPDYAQQVSVTDRWAIVGYVRALQLSRHAPLDRLSPEDRAKLPEGGPRP
ncbi:MAG TPA: cytochrome c [Gemmataceae bacterium]|nr:cytochrome c [Gemmataceae bacterium]